ncbi:MAG: hypothetical protein ACLUPV_13615 [Bilophila wadsworthia]
MMGNISGDIGAAAVYGWIAGHHAGDYKTLGQPADVDGAPFCQERMAFFSSLYERSGGVVAGSELRSQQIMTEYADCGRTPPALRYAADGRYQIYRRPAKKNQ